LKEEDCVTFNADRIQVKKIQGCWKIVEGDHWIFDFGNKLGEARKSLILIKQHGFRKSCYIGRPNPSFSYLRR